MISQSLPSPTRLESLYNLDTATITQPPLISRTYPYERRQATVLNYAAVAGFVTGDGDLSVGCENQSVYVFDQDQKIAGCCNTVDGAWCELPTSCVYEATFEAAAADVTTGLTTCSGDRPQCAINFLTDIGYSNVYCASSTHPSAVLLARIPTKNVRDIDTASLGFLSANPTTFPATNLEGDTNLSIDLIGSSSTTAICRTSGCPGGITSTTPLSIPPATASASSTTAATSSSHTGPDTRKILSITLPIVFGLWLILLGLGVLWYRRRKKGSPSKYGSTMVDGHGNAMLGNIGSIGGIVNNYWNREGHRIGND